MKELSLSFAAKMERLISFWRLGLNKQSRLVLHLATILAILINFTPSAAIALDTSSTAFLSDSTKSELINNSSFTDVNSMTLSEIQKFLEDKGSVLATIGSDKLGDGANGRSAAQIIYEASRGLYPAAVGPGADGDWKGIKVNSTTGTVSPKIILSYLEKEMSLITRAPEQWRLDCAMGYEFGEGCTNMFNNHPSLKGFSNQVGNGAWQLRYNYEYAIRGTKPAEAAIHHIVNDPIDKPYCEDKYYDSGSPYYDPTCFGLESVSEIKMTNAASAAIYSYTPYIFDSAYVVWKIFNNWFTATPEAAPAPVPNDTAEYNLKTFSENITVGGTKSSDVRVYFNNQLIQDVGTTNWQLTFVASIGMVGYSVEYRDTKGNVVATKPVSVNRHKLADINGDTGVNIQDLSILATYWGQTKPAEALTDLNGDGIVDILDLSLFASNWNG